MRLLLTTVLAAVTAACGAVVVYGQGMASRDGGMPGSLEAHADSPSYTETTSPRVGEPPTSSPLTGEPLTVSSAPLSENPQLMRALAGTTLISPASLASAESGVEQPTWVNRWLQGSGFSSLPAVCDDCPNRALVAFVGYDSWRGISDDSWQNNGLHVGLNFGTRLGAFSDLTGVGFQIGGSAGVYNWAGTDYRPEQTSAQPQGFVTYGFYRKANENSNWSAVLVQDWMFNSNFGVFSQNPTLSQCRAQLGYAISASDEFGMWGAWRTSDSTRFVNGVGSTSWRPIDQLNFFWHHKWAPGGADTTIWAGMPEQDRLAGGGSLGAYLAGASANVPLSERLALYTLVTYMHQSARAGGIGATEDAWNFTVGVAYYPARNARSSTVAGQCWTPMLPVANNGYFLVDTNNH